ncbi:hypothetical protein K1719_027344 [Acacia pycnantha]|nr:hypothetical protein K1719_027344 [Acacia pycnantha]
MDALESNPTSPSFLPPDHNPPPPPPESFASDLQKPYEQTVNFDYQNSLKTLASDGQNVNGPPQSANGNGHVNGLDHIQGGADSNSNSKPLSARPFIYSSDDEPKPVIQLPDFMGDIEFDPKIQALNSRLLEISRMLQSGLPLDDRPEERKMKLQRNKVYKSEAIISSLRIEGLVKLGPLAENLATAGALDLPMKVPPSSSRARGLSVEFIQAFR